MWLSAPGAIRRVRDRPRLRAWVGVLGGAGVVVVAYLCGVVWRSGRRLDDRALRSAERVGAAVAPEVHVVLAYLSPAVVLVGLIAVVVRDLRGGARQQALTALVLVVGSELVAQGVKLLLPRIGGGTNTLPSGHLTMIAAFVLVLAASGRWRRLGVVIGVVVVVGSAVGTWVIGWHRPSDTVAAGGVVALCWGATRLPGGLARCAQQSGPGSGFRPGLADQPTVPSMRRI